jgi:hypothetical protein
MSYNDKACYVAEHCIKNRLEALLKPIVGMLSGRNAPLIVTNDKKAGCLATCLFCIQPANQKMASPLSVSKRWMRSLST